MNKKNEQRVRKKKSIYGSPATIRIAPKTEAELMLLAQYEKIPEVHMRSKFFQRLVAKECKSLYNRLSAIRFPTDEELKLKKKMDVMYGVFGQSSND